MSGRMLAVAGRILPLLLLGLLGAGSLGGCASSCTGNPATDNYFCAQRNMGAYQNQLSQKQQQTENLQDENVQLQRQNQDLAAQQKDLNQQIDKVSAELKTLDTDLSKMNARIEKARSNNAVNQQKLTQAQRELQRVQEGLDPMGVIRDPNHPMIETNLDESLAHMAQRRPELARS